MNKLIILAFINAITFRAFAQINLVPNPGFEIHDSCPTLLNQLNYATYWIRVHGTPDLFHKCSTTPLTSIPNNFAGYQPTMQFEDSAYTGIINTPGGNIAREMIGITLLDTLQPGTQYYISFFISCSFNLGSLPTIRCFTNKLGIRFFTEPKGVHDSLIDNFAHLSSDTIISDTANWVKFQGSFIADSLYTFLVIGNFFISDSLNIVCYDSSLNNYYYLDNFCLSTDSVICNVSTEIQSIYREIFPEIYFDFATSSLFVNYESEPNLKEVIIIYNLLGELIFSSKIYSKKNQFYIYNINSGLYIISINQKIIKKIFSIK